MNKAEIEFIMKMRDEATALLNKLGHTFSDTGKGAKDLANQGDKAAGSLGNLTKFAKEAAVAVGGVWASIKAGRAVSGAFGEYEQGLANISRISTMTGRDLDNFRVQFDKLNQSIHLIPTEQLQETAAALSQMGVANQDLVQTTEVVTKLATTTGLAGDQVAMLSLRILSLTGEGTKGIQSFGDTLALLDRSSNATAAQILEMARNVAQGTAAFNFSSKAVLGLSTAATEAGLNAELLRSSTQRAMLAITTGAAQGSKGFRNFLAIANLTREQFDDLQKNHPEEIFIRLAEAYKRLIPTGKAPAFLASLGISSQETATVFNSLSKNIDRVREDMRTAVDPSAIGEAQRQFDTLNETQKGHVLELQKAWELLKVRIGAAMAPLLAPVLQGLIAGVRVLTGLFEGLHPIVQAGLGTILLIGPAVYGVIKAVGLLRLAWQALNLTIATGTGPAIAAAAAEVEAAGAVVGETAAVKAGGGFMAKFGSVLKNLGLFALAAGIGDIIGTGIAQGINATMPDIANSIAKWRDDSGLGGFLESITGIKANKSYLRDSTGRTREEVAAAEKAQAAAAAAAKGQGGGAQPGSGAPDDPLAGTDFTGKGHMIEDTLQNLRAQITSARALTGIEKNRADLNDQILQAAKATGLAYDDVAKQIGGVVAELQAARAAAAVYDLVRGYDQQIDDAKAITAEQKNQVEIQHALADLEKDYAITAQQRAQVTAKLQELQAARAQAALTELLRGYEQQRQDAAAITAEQKNQLEINRAIAEQERQYGALTAKAKQDIRESIQLLQAQRKAAAYTETIRDLDQQLISAAAVTREEQNRLDVLMKIADFERTNGQLTPDARAGIADRMAMLQQVSQFRQLQDRLDPLGAATRSYQDDLATLNAQFKDKSSADYKFLLDQLNKSYEDSRNPLASFIRTQKDAIATMRVVGSQREVLGDTLDMMESFRDKGLRLTTDQWGELRQAVMDYNQAMHDANQADTSGIRGWMRSIGTFKEEFQDMTKDVVSDFASSLTDALTGEGGASLTKFLQNTGKRMVAFAVNNLLKESLSNLFPSLNKNPALDRADAALAKIDALSQAGINAPTAVVNAASVSINGKDLNQLLSMLAAGRPSVALPANDNAMRQQFGNVGNGTSTAVDLAAGLLGQTETGNRGSINAFLKRGGVNLDAATTAWCAAFVNSALKQIGVTGSGSNVATSFLNWGVRVDPSQVMRGDVLVDANGRAAGQTGGHVGFATGNTRTGANGQLQIEMLSGNTGNKVGTGWYDARELQVRRADIDTTTRNLSTNLQTVQTALESLSTTAGNVGQGLGAAGAGAGALGGAGAAPSITPDMGALNAMDTSVVATQSAALKQAGADLATTMQTTTVALKQAKPGFADIAGGIASLIPVFAQAIPGLSGFAKTLISMIPMILSAIGGSGPGGGVAGGITKVVGFLGSIFHGGGEVGATNAPGRWMPQNAWYGAPRLHTGFANDEYPAILQRGERVLTEGQNRRNLSLIDGLTGQVQQLGDIVKLQAQRGGAGGGRWTTNNVNMNVSAKDANSFNRSRGQMMSQLAAELTRQARRNN